jgi:hypothetical protein
MDNNNLDNETKIYKECRKKDIYIKTTAIKNTNLKIQT